MSRTPEERTATNRENARHSTGPKSPEGKARSRNNALKHGLRAATPAALPNEDPAVIQQRADEWNDYYRPQSPAARHLVEECVRATLMADRCDHYHSSALAGQVREAEAEWEERRKDEFVELIAMLQTDPREAVRRLRRTGHGCRAMIGFWDALRAALAANGCWDDAERDQAVRLLGADPRPEVAHLSPVADSVRLNNELARPVPSAAKVGRLLAPHRVPPELRETYSAETLPRPDVSRAFLTDVAAGELDDLRDRERVCREEIEGPDRAEVVNCALILRGDPARLFLRYHAESRTAFHRAYKALLQTLERDAAEADSSSPNEPTEVRQSSPNEPNSPGEGSPNEPIARELARSEPPADYPNEPNHAGPATATASRVSPNDPNFDRPVVSPNEPTEGRGGQKSNGPLTPDRKAGETAADLRGIRRAKGVRSAQLSRSARGQAVAR